MPRSYEPGPLAEAIKQFNSGQGLKDREIRKSVEIATGLDSRLVMSLMKEENPLTEKTIDIICCNYLRVHPWNVYGDWYFGDRVEKYMAELDEQYGTNISTYCQHDWEVIPASQIPELEDTLIVRRLVEAQEITIVRCDKCERYSHSLSTPLKACG